ncbi:DUF4386 domain-containing protein [Salmonirosea aquatica]|uniref:DUF4386 family protein n=1 Tax=Salmonirosea aquatica TaxID=2654236 RepID=A0A7C9FEE1_9BACT|nr:DUF4386 family protein [Cytophagaceae bacterium SJW1-29]
MTSRNRTARLAGLLYLTLLIFGILSIVYIPSQLIVWEDGTKTVKNIKEFEILFRVGIASGIIAFLAFMFLSLLLYKLLHKVNETQARLMVLFVLISIPISFVNMLHRFSVLSLVSKPAYLQGYDSIVLHDQVMLQLEYFNNGVQISYIFTGLWLFPFGYLVYKSEFLPKVIGILLIISGTSYLVDFFGKLLFLNYQNTIIPIIVGIPGSIGEFAVCLWLLIMGTNKLKIGKTANSI